jgi:hypothetical protein
MKYNFILTAGGSYKENNYPAGHYRLHAYLEPYFQGPVHSLAYSRKNQYIPDIVEQPLVLDMIQNWSAEEAKSIVVEKRWEEELKLHHFQSIINFLRGDPSTEQRQEFITTRSWYIKDHNRSDPDIASWVKDDPYVPPPADAYAGIRRSTRRKRTRRDAEIPEQPSFL